MFSRSSLYREVMTHRESIGYYRYNDKLHQRQQMTRIKTTVVARTIYLTATSQKPWRMP